MKKYDVAIKTIRENKISVLATCKADAISKVEELLACSSLKDLDMKNYTKHYIELDAIKIPVFRKKKHHLG